MGAELGPGTRNSPSDWSVRGSLVLPDFEDGLRGGSPHNLCVCGEPGGVGVGFVVGDDGWV